MAERVHSDFSHSQIAEMLLQFKNKGALIDTLHKMDFDNLNDLSYVVNAMEPIYNNEVKKRVKENKMVKMKHSEILRALYNLQSLHPLNFFNYNHDIVYCKNLIKNLQSIKCENLSEINKKLTIIEKNMTVLPLYVSLTKAAFYTYICNLKDLNKDVIMDKLQIKKTQLYYYLNFYDLLRKYRYLIRISLSFSTIVKNVTVIRNIIENDDGLKNICSTKLPLFDHIYMQ
ncbi:unnamed protein product [Rotaria magnacalcarata]|uniref:Uncharacterized protein n=2 Tax=Rotaria magnacalcarata TaxID=392030 RepID=A0A820J9X6_9BILA|nr:unnamed protein product [Rotaria magnacalcarata]